MKEIIRLLNPSPEISTIFDFVVKNQFDDLTPLREIRESFELDTEFQKQWTKLSKKEKGLYLKKIESFSFSSEDNYEVPSGSQQDFYDCMNTLTKVKEEVSIFIEWKYILTKAQKDAYQMVRQVSPPIDAYKYIPFNKTDIKPSTRAYGLLFT